MPLDTIERIEVLHGRPVRCGAPTPSMASSTSSPGGRRDARRARRRTIGDGGRHRCARAIWRRGRRGLGVAHRRDGRRRRRAQRGRRRCQRLLPPGDGRRALGSPLERRCTQHAGGAAAALETDELQEEALYVPPYVQPLPLRLEFDRALLAARHEQRISAGLTTNLSASFTAENVRASARAPTCARACSTSRRARSGRPPASTS